ncbi:hypothetical protein ACS0TY_018049 [Phlomoides rotata]
MDSLRQCKKMCGKMDIPYPFGIKKGCYLDESFEISCNDSSSSTSLVSHGKEAKLQVKCGFFAFVDKEFPVNKLIFSAYQTSVMNTSILITYSVPTILEWGVGNTSSNKAVGRANYVCGHNTDCIDTNFDMLNAYRCKCRNGFTGNPYLLEGCQGCCLETEVLLLVYEYVTNGTLSDHIQDEPNTPTIYWGDHLRIAAKVAEALAYLHSYASTTVFHRDIKSNNVLLDAKCKALVGDFGLSRTTQ